jgi:hypothetical protein
MKVLTQNLNLLTLLFLSGTLMFLYPASILTMDHSVMEMETLMVHGSVTGQSLISCLPVSNTDQCVNYHLNLLEKLSQTIPQTSVALSFFAVIVFALSFLALGSTKQILNYIEFLFLLKHHRLKKISLAAFMTELGNWLAVIENKVPAYAFTTA